MSSDPLGLVLAAVASGLALACATAAVLEASSRVRMALGVSALTLLIVWPTLLVARIGGRSHTSRAVERTLAPTPSAREAWSPSFRLEPAGAPDAAPSLTASLAARVVAGIGDGRLVSLLALGVVLVSAVRLTALPLASLAVVMAQPSVALGTVFGASTFVWLGAFLVAVCAVRQRATRLRCLAALAGPAVVLDQWLGGSRDAGPGVGLVNVASYASLESAPLLHVLLPLGSLVVLAAALWTWRSASTFAEILAGACLALLLALVFAPAASPFGLCAPLSLLLFAASPASSETVARPA